MRDSDNKMNNKVTIFIDNEPHQVSNDNNLLAGVLSEKLNLPYFCWHPSMGSVGACRQCAVIQYQDENDTRGRMVMSCMTPVKEGMRIGIKAQQASHFREQIISAMMTNHPHDCPVCAEGGECHLQDMTVMTGHTTRSYVGDKRTFENQYLGDLVGHEMNRCITCYRCVRFYKDYAGGDDFGVYGSANHIYFGRQKDGPLESEFSGNLVEVCPTGVFTNKLFSAHYSRKWDLQSAPSVCSHCAVGCNTSIGERYGSVRRVVNRFNEKINGYFLCDRGRYGIGFVNGEQRIRVSRGLVKELVDPSDEKSSDQQNDQKEGQNNAINSSKPTKKMTQKISHLDVAKALVHFRGEKFIGIGSERASLEANFYLQQLVGKENFSAGWSNNEMALAAQHQQLLHLYPAPSLIEIEQSDFVFIVGEDLTQTSPRMALSVRQALRNLSFVKAASLGIAHWQDEAVRTVGTNDYSPLFSLNSVATKLDNTAKSNLLLTPEQMVSCIKKLNVELNQMLDDDVSEENAALNSSSNSTSPPNFNANSDDCPDHLSEPCRHFINTLLSYLARAKKPLIISGWSLQSPDLLQAVNQLMATLHSEVFKKKHPTSQLCRLAILPRQCNSVGVLSMIDEQSLSIEELLQRLRLHKSDSVILLEQELQGLAHQQLELLRAQAKTIIVLDHSDSAISLLADIVMPVAAVSEGDGHYVNYQGIVQRYHQVHVPQLPIQDSWRWLDSIAHSIFMPKNYNQHHSHNHSLHELNIYLTDQFIGWPLNDIAFNTDVNTKGIARQTHRASGRTSQRSNVNIHESKTTQSRHDEFTFSMEGLRANASAEIPYVWAPGWNSNQSIFHYQEAVGGGLIKPVNETRLSFVNGEQMLIKWPSSALENSKTLAVGEYVTENSASETASESVSKNSEELTFIHQPSWHQVDWQANFLPEFKLLHQINRLVLSVQYAAKKGFKSGQYVTLTFDFTSSNITTLALISLDEKLPEQLCYGKISQLNYYQKLPAPTIKLATEIEINMYQQQESIRIDNAHTAKKAMLSQLKMNDQYIPIRLMSGGLDDV